jgi:coenzyme F420-reducing hydrogenase delta subunit/biotin operon repressor
MCTGRVDLSFVMRAFHGRAGGVIVGGCWPGECHYVTEGNFDALGNVHLCKRLLTNIGLRPERLRIEWIAASEGIRFAEIMSDFVSQVNALGPLGQAEGIDDADLDLRLEAVSQLIPYLKLVEREKLRVPVKSEAAYDTFYKSAEMDRLFDSLIADRLAVSQLLLCLKERPLSTGDISTRLGMSSSEVAKHVRSSSSRGLIRYDQQQGRYALA